MKTKIEIGSLLALALLLLVGPALAEDKAVTVGYIPIGDCLQLYVAKDMGFFEHEGLTVEQKAMKGGAVIAPAVESGEADVGWSNAISIIIAHSKGFDFGFITSGAISIEGGHRVHSLLAGKDSGIAGVAGLKGKTVAVNTLGNINELSMVALLDAHGLKPEDVKLVEVPFPAMETALTKGGVDAVLAVEPFVTLILSHGAADMLVQSVHASYGKKFMIGSWFAKKSWVKGNPETAAAFARAINKASDFVNAHPDMVPEILVNNTKLTAGLVEKITMPAFDSQFDPQDLQQMINLAAQYRFIPEAFPAADVILDVE